MANKFISDETPFHKGCYAINLPDELYEVAAMTKGSFNTIMCRLFGLSPANFLRVARDQYSATISGKKGYMGIFFKEKKDADRLCKELNKRWKYWMEGV